MSGERYLWFAPNAGLWPSFRLEHRLADALARSGRSVTMIHCGGVLDSYCPVMSAERLQVTSPRGAKAQSCRDCQYNAGITRERAMYRSVLLDSYVTPQIRTDATTLARSVTPGTWADLVVDDIPVGRYAAYLSMLHHKVPDVTATPAAWAEYVSDLRNALLVLGALPALFDDVDPTHAVVYNPLYPTNRMLAETARRRDVRLVGIHAGGYIPARYEAVGIYGHIANSQTLVDSPTVRAGLDEPCTPAEVAAVGRHLRELMAGTDPWVYSAASQRPEPTQLRGRLGLRADAPVVVALLSSPDETRASMLVDAEFHRDAERGYSDISEFIRAVRRLAVDRPEIDVVLRLHPRLTPNKREQVTSPDLDAILAELADLPANAHVNAPGDGVSLYDLVRIASAAVNQSSSSGLEFSVFGRPVVSFDPVRQGAYPPEFGPCVDRDDPSALAAAVARAVAEPAQSPVWLERSVAAFRWYATVTLRDLLLLSDLTPEPVRAASPPPGSPPPAPTSPPARLGAIASAGIAFARRLVPAELRERAARAVSRRGRTATLPTPASDAWWRAEWLQRLDAADLGGPIWRPPVLVRGERVSDAVAAERAAVREQLAALDL